MKKVISVVICFVLIFAFAGCSGKSGIISGGIGKNEIISDGSGMQTILDPGEYILYQNIFYNQQGGDYVGKQITKKGVFTKLYDEYNKVTRYYVWGYNDNTKCCDWQWEIVPTSTENLPKVGSTVEATGIFAASDKALDGYWFENVTLTVTHEYGGSKANVDMTTMGGTLERVQIMNMQRFPESFEGKTVAVYGRAQGSSSVQHPYYNECFSQQFVSSDPIQPTGTVIIVSGVYRSGIIAEASVEKTDKF